MDDETIALAIQGLEAQREKIETALKDLRFQLKSGRQRGPTKVVRRKRTMSAAARKAISEAQKKRWAKQKKA